MFKVIQHSRNVHEINFDTREAEIAMLSDIHWDNPHCDWDLLKKHLDYFKKNNIPVMINGDMFCLMQGRGDNRRNKSDIRPEHNNARYLDSIVETAVEFWAPYADILTIIGYGNHETGVIKYQETDILQLFVDLLNYKCNSNVFTGGYGGWIVAKLNLNSAESSFNIKYMHGSGGGGVVTKGALNLTRAMEIYEGYDVFTMGHIHENSARNDVRDTLKCNSKIGYEVQHKYIHNMITGTYKEEYNDGASGWHVERGAPVKPLGGRILKLKMERAQINNTRRVQKYVDSTQIFV
jgi:hypothetical protein